MGGRVVPGVRPPSNLSDAPDFQTFLKRELAAGRPGFSEAPILAVGCVSPLPGNSNRDEAEPARFVEHSLLSPSPRGTPLTKS